MRKLLGSFVLVGGLAACDTTSDVTREFSPEGLQQYGFTVTTRGLTAEPVGIAYKIADRDGMVAICGGYIGRSTSSDAFIRAGHIRLNNERIVSGLGYMLTTPVAAVEAEGLPCKVTQVAFSPALDGEQLEVELPRQLRGR